MENSVSIHDLPFRLGDRSTSDVVVRLRTPEGRDEWLYSHSTILVEKSKYFADRLSDTWPTCQILDARNCVEVYCQECDVDYNITLLRLLYLVTHSLISESWHGVRNSLGILRVAIELSCPQIVSSCVEYLEAVPWEEADEEEILRTAPSVGPTASLVLARLQPVDQTLVLRIFSSAIRFAMSSPPPSMHDLKSSTQEQIEYMLTDDDDAPLVSLPVCDEVKSEVRECVKSLSSKFSTLLDSLLNDMKETDFEEGEKFDSFQSYLSDISWACQVCGKLEIMRVLVHFWLENSNGVLMLVEKATSKFKMMRIKMKVTEVATKVLEAIGYGNVVLPTVKRLQMVKLWLPFARATKPLVDVGDEEESLKLKVDCEMWQTMESAFVSIILALPSEDQAEILTEWLANQHINYPDLTEAFEVWCYRSKVAKKRLALVDSYSKFPETRGIPWSFFFFCI